MGLVQLFPPRVRRGLRRLRQDVENLATAFRKTRRPVARTGAVTDPSIYRACLSPRAESPPFAEQRADSQPPTEHSVLFADHDTRVVVEEGQTILDAGLQAGLDLDFSCTVGGCAACALQIVEGEVVYDGPNCLSDAERESGMCLACVGRPRGTVTVDSL